MAGRNPFEPIGEQARWKTVYEIIKAAPTDHLITYEVLADALGLHPVDDRDTIRGAVHRAAREHEVTDKRAVEAVRGEGYRPVDQQGSLILARGQQVKSGKALVRGHSKAVNVDLNGVDPQVRAALETIGKAFVLQMDFNKRFQAKQDRLEEAIRDISDSQAGDRKRTDDELAELRERLARLEGGKKSPARPLAPGDRQGELADGAA